MKFPKIALCVTLLCTLLVGCAPKAEPVTAKIFAMNTMMSLTVEGADAQRAVDAAVDEIYALERMLSTTLEDSDLWKINHANGDRVSVRTETMVLTQRACTLASQTDGAFDPTIFPILTRWGFTTGEYQVLDEQTIAELLPLVDYTAIEVDEETQTVRIPSGMSLDFGGIAKGYVADCLAEILTAYDLDRALLNLGGNVYAMGTKADQSAWQVGIQSPEDSRTLAKVSVEGGTSVVTSGGYQRFFEEDGITYWHILDPHTGAPADTDLRSVTIVAEDGARCDALSTALFVMGRVDAEQFWRTHQDFDVVLVGEDGGIAISPDLEEHFALLDGVTASVEVIAP